QRRPHRRRHPLPAAGPGGRVRAHRRERGQELAARQRRQPPLRPRRPGDLRVLPGQEREELSMTKPLNVGMIGYGFMGRAHSNAYSQVNHFFDLQYRPVAKAACARSLDKVKPFADKWGYESVETDWRKLIERKDIDLIDICTPNNTHAEIALAGARAGKMILCEKPLAMNGPEGLKM